MGTFIALFASYKPIFSPSLHSHFLQVISFIFSINTIAAKLLIYCYLLLNTLNHLNTNIIPKKANHHPPNHSPHYHAQIQQVVDFAPDDSLSVAK